MNRIPYILVVAIIAASAALTSCSANRGDPLVAGSEELPFGGSLLSGSNLANTTVTAQNQFILCQKVFWELYDSYLLANRQAAKSYTTKTVRFLADYTGNAVVNSGASSISSDGQTSSYEATVTYNDYSSNGKLFMGGEITFRGIWRKIDIRTLPVSLTLDGGVVFAGDYKGSIRFIEFKLGIYPEGGLIVPGTKNTGFPADGDVIIESGGTTRLVYPYPDEPEE